MIGAKCYSESNSLNYLVLLAGVSNFYFCMLDTGDLIVPANCIANPEKKESGKKSHKIRQCWNNCGSFYYMFSFGHDDHLVNDLIELKIFTCILYGCSSHDAWCQTQSSSDINNGFTYSNPSNSDWSILPMTRLKDKMSINTGN